MSPLFWVKRYRLPHPGRRLTAVLFVLMLLVIALAMLTLKEVSHGC
jgi:hypothetical protein